MALASGIPAIGPASGGLKDRISHGANGLQYSRGDLSGMLLAVQRLAKNAALRRRMGAAAREGVVDRSWSMVTQLLTAYYRDALTAFDPRSHLAAQAAAHRYQDFHSVGA